MPVKNHTGLLLHQFGTFKIRLFRSLLSVTLHILPVSDLRLIFIQDRVFRRNYHISDTKQGIASCSINPQFIFFSRNGEIHFRPFGFSDPVFLGHGDLLHIVHTVKPFDQLFRIVRDLQHPLAFYLPDHLRAAAFAHAVHHFLIGKPHLTGSTPVDRHLRFIGKSLLKKLQKDPLGPVIIARICGIDLSVPVKGITQRMKLVLKTPHIVLCHDLRMDLVCDRIVFRRQAKRVPAHREQYVISLHPALTGHDIHRRIGPRVPHMKPLP